MTKHIKDVIASRRALLGGFAGLPLLSLAQSAAGTEPVPPEFQSVDPTNADTISLPPGYRWRTLIAWGDALFEGMSSFDPDALNRADQERRFGQNNDMLALFPADYSFPFASNTQRYLLCANHEYVEPSLLFPALAALQDFTPAHVEAALAAIGCTVVEVEQNGGEWRIVKNPESGNGRNRRITPFSPVIFSGAAANHRWIRAGATAFNAAEPAGPDADPNEVRCGTLANCAGGRTPWGTYLTSEENFNTSGTMLTDASAPALAAAQTDTAWILASGNFGTPLYSTMREDQLPPRFDVSANPYGPAVYGWVVEIDPYDPTWVPRKRTSLGRKKGECANTALTKNGRVAVYMGDDQIDEFIYKFISTGHFDPNNRTGNRDLLDEGQLYVARFNEDGAGDWLPLNLERINSAVAEAPYHARFEDTGDVAIRAREAARLLGATPMDRPEDVEPLIDADWLGRGTILLSCTYNRNEEFYRPGNPRRGDAQANHIQQSNVGGHILRIDEHNNDCGATRFRWDVFTLAGDPRADNTFTLPNGIAADVSVTIDGRPTFEGDRFSCPDNLCVDNSDNLWIATDGSDSVFPDCNDSVMIAPIGASGPRPVKRFLVAPVGAEVCGPTLAFDETAFFCAIQHPGEANSAGVSNAELRWRNHQRPPSNFPDGGDSWPRSAVVVVTREDGGRVGS
ncbi:MAG: DUF839 domain-containing protein [Hyphomonadaceae bacterium]|nr:DUF839 domain-containing protein [Hyphomonadaceae bacterium]